MCLKVFRFWLILLSLFISNAGLAQEYHKFRFGAGFGGTEQRNLSIWYAEPSLYINDKISLGLRLESYLRPNVEQCFSYTLSSQFYFANKILMNKKLRFFAGVGLGIFSAINKDTIISATPNGVLFQYKEGIAGARGGFYPRIGFELNRFTFTFEYNLIYRREIRTTYFLRSATGLQTWSTPLALNSDNYASFKIGYFFGGGKKAHVKIVEFDKQNFRKIRVGFGLGYADSRTNNGYSTTGAVVLYVEPSYRIRNHISLGVRIERLVNSSFQVNSYGVNGQYYFSNRNFRTFAGVGLSVFRSSFYVRNFPSPYFEYYSSGENPTLGIYPRAGFDAGHFTLTIDWNLIGSAGATINNFDILNGINQTYSSQIETNYLSIKAGVFIGGGRKVVSKKSLDPQPF
jgi:hypothetical protein